MSAELQQTRDLRPNTSAPNFNRPSRSRNSPWTALHSALPERSVLPRRNKWSSSASRLGVAGLVVVHGASSCIAPNLRRTARARTRWVGIQIEHTHSAQKTVPCFLFQLLARGFPTGLPPAVVITSPCFAMAARAATSRSRHSAARSNNDKPPQSVTSYSRTIRWKNWCPSSLNMGRGRRRVSSSPVLGPQNLADDILR